jgi:hypothetical protein
MTKLKFTKMHGCGNDYIYINCLEGEIENPENLAISLSDRHFGIGGDGLVLICKSDIAMEIKGLLNRRRKKRRMHPSIGPGIRAIRCVIGSRDSHGGISS